MGIRRMATVVTVCMLFACNFAMFEISVMADNEDPDGEGKVFGDWNISLSKSFKDQTIEVSGNLTVMNGGTLKLDNVTLIMNSTPQKEWTITVNLGGSLQIINGSVVTNNATFDRPYYFSVEYGGGLTFTDSTIRNVGNKSLPWDFTLTNIMKMGLIVASTGVNIQRSVIEDSHVGTLCSSLLPVTPTIENNTYRNNTGGFAYALACNPEARHNTFEDNDAGLTILLKASAGVDSGTFIGNKAGILTSLSTISIVDSSFDGNTEAAISAFAGSSVTVERSELVSNRNATYLDNSSLDMIDCIVNASTQWDFFLDNVSSAKVLNTTIDDRDGIKVNDTESDLELSWYLDVRAQDLSGQPVTGAIVNVTTVHGSRVVNTATGANGWMATEEVVELVDEGAGPFYFTPHNVTAEKGAFYNLTNVVMDRSRTLVLTLYERDLIAPDITIDQPEAGSHTNVTLVHVAGVAYDNDELAMVEVRVGTGNWTNATGTDAWSVDAVLPTDGRYDICARARDVSGNVGSECINVTLDRVVPALVVTEPEDGQYFNHSQLFVKGTTDAALLTINGEEVSVFQDSFSHAITLTADGARSITVVAKDLAGNTNSTTIVVYRDLVAPSISVLSPQPFSIINTTAVTIGGNVSDSLGVEGMTASTDNVTWRQVDINFSTSENRTGAFTVGLTLVEGENEVHLKAVDRAGNERGYTFNLTVDLPDLVPPEVRIETPKDGDRIEGLSVTVTGTASDDEDVAFLVVKVGGLDFTPTTNDDWATWRVNVSLAEGMNIITATATDGGGNKDEDSVSVTAIRPVVDEEVPNVAITTPSNNKVTHRKTIKVEGTATDNVAVKSVFVSVRPSGSTDEPQWVLADLDAGTGTWSTEVTLGKGWNEIAVKVVDTSQNNETVTVLVKYEKAEAGLDYTMVAVLSLVIIILIVVYLATLPGRKRAKRAGGEGPAEEEDGFGEEE